MKAMEFKAQVLKELHELQKRNVKAATGAIQNVESSNEELMSLLEQSMSVLDCAGYFMSLEEGEE